MQSQHNKNTGINGESYGSNSSCAMPSDAANSTDEIASKKAAAEAYQGPRVQGSNSGDLDENGAAGGFPKYPAGQGR